MEEQEVIQREPKTELWLRLLYMLLFVLIYSVAELVVATVAILQFGFVLFTGHHNKRLLQFGRNVSAFVYAILRFFMFDTEDKPFPFADWPNVEKSSV